MATVHTRALRAAGLEVVGVASSSAERAASAASALGIVRSFRSPEALVESSDIDVVHICSPNATHAPIAHVAIAAGKHIVCEKPLAATITDARALAFAATGAGVRTAVPFIYRFYAAVREIRARIARGDIGAPLLLHGAYLQDWLATPQATNWRVDVNEGGASRAFADIGVHWCDLVEFVTGQRITRLSAKLVTAFGRRGGSTKSVGTEDVVTMMFETDGGANGSVTVSQVSSGRKNQLTFSIDGENGAFAFNQEDPNTFWTGSIDENRIVASGSSAMTSADARRLALLPPGHPQGYQDAFVAFVSDAYRHFAGEQVEGIPTFDDGLRSAQITDAVLRSSALEVWIDVTDARLTLTDTITA
jgi:predicted dehydrogenase